MTHDTSSALAGMPPPAGARYSSSQHACSQLAKALARGWSLVTGGPAGPGWQGPVCCGGSVGDVWRCSVGRSQAPPVRQARISAKPRVFSTQVGACHVGVRGQRLRSRGVSQDRYGVVPGARHAIKAVRCVANRASQDQRGDVRCQPRVTQSARSSGCVAMPCGSRASPPRARRRS